MYNNVHFISKYFKIMFLYSVEKHCALESKANQDQKLPVPASLRVQNLLRAFVTKLVLFGH